MQENSIIKNILSRRSIRSYKQEQVSDNELDTIIRCGINAPSARNWQPWEVRVVQNKEILAEINTDFIEAAKGKSLQGSAARAQEPDFNVFHSAPTLIVIAADTENHYRKGDCGMLAQNISLSAESLNIGTCVVGNVADIINHSANLRKKLAISDTYEVLFGIAIGYKNENPTAKPREANKVQWIR
jgi:nitroreductase